MSYTIAINFCCQSSEPLDERLAVKQELQNVIKIVCIGSVIQSYYFGNGSNLSALVFLYFPRIDGMLWYLCDVRVPITVDDELK